MRSATPWQLSLFGLVAFLLILPLSISITVPILIGIGLMTCLLPVVWFKPSLRWLNKQQQDQFYRRFWSRVTILAYTLISLCCVLGMALTTYDHQSVDAKRLVIIITGILATMPINIVFLAISAIQPIGFWLMLPSLIGTFVGVAGAVWLEREPWLALLVVLVTSVSVWLWNRRFSHYAIVRSA